MFRWFRYRPAIMPHDPGLAASPRARCTLEVEKGADTLLLDPGIQS
jgi:hypothetical protein